MKKKIKIIAIGFLASIGLGAGITAATPVTTSAATAAPEIEIVGQNLSLESTIHIKYAVDVANTEETDNVGMLLWKEAQESYVYGTQAAILEKSNSVMNGEETYQTFVYEDLAACEMTDVVYTCAYVERDGEYYYSAPKKYSILEYAYNKLGKTEATATTDGDLTNLLNSMLSYGAMAQIYFDYNLDKLATDSFTYVRMDNATFEDGFSYGIFKVGERVKFAINEGYHVRADLSENIEADENGAYILTIPSQKYIENTLIHAYIEEIDEGVLPTCTQTGLTQGTHCSACGEVIIAQETIPASEHTYDQEVVNDGYLQSEATCTESAKYYYSCVCGACGAETFDYGEPTACNYVNGICQWCGQEEVITEGLVFTLINEDTEYSVTDYTGTATEVYIPSTYNGKPVTSIGHNAFQNNRRITTIIISEGVINIGYSAFYNCDNLINVVIPNSVTDIGSTVFYSCESLIYNEKDGLQYLGNVNNPYLYLAGIANKDMITAMIDNNCRFIGSHSLECSAALTSIEIPNSVTSIGSYAFWSCENLTKIIMPDSVTHIAKNAFYECNNLKNIYISDITAWCNIVGLNELMYFGSNEKNLYLKNVLVTELIIPENVTRIGSYAFYKFSSLTSITFSNTSTWYRTTSSVDCDNKTGGTYTDVTNSSTNATYFKSTYYNYYWYKL